MTADEKERFYIEYRGKVLSYIRSRIFNASDVEAGLERAFANCNPRKDKISIVVANDSYAEYSVLRDFLKAREYDLRPIVGKEGTFVADQGGTNQKAE